MLSLVCVPPVSLGPCRDCGRRAGWDLEKAPGWLAGGARSPFQPADKWEEGRQERQFVASYLLLSLQPFYLKRQ